MNKEQLRKQIEEQEQENIKLFTPIQYRIHEESSQPILKKWREGSAKLKALLDELYRLEMIERDKRVSEQNSQKKEKTFINSYGEATNRYITNQTYERAERRKQREVLSFIGNR